METVEKVADVLREDNPDKNTFDYTACADWLIRWQEAVDEDDVKAKVIAEKALFGKIFGGWAKSRALEVIKNEQNDAGVLGCVEEAWANGGESAAVGGVSEVAVRGADATGTDAVVGVDPVDGDGQRPKVATGRRTRGRRVPTDLPTGVVIMARRDTEG